MLVMCVQVKECKKSSNSKTNIKRMSPTAALKLISVAEIVLLTLHPKTVRSKKYTLSKITLTLTDVTNISPLGTKRLPSAQGCLSNSPIQ